MREANSHELARWTAFKKYFDTTVTPSVNRAVLVATFAADSQTELEKIGSPTDLFNAVKHDRVMTLIDRYNRLSRIVVGVETQKYGIRVAGDKIDVLAPSDTKKETIQDDIWQGFGIGPAILIIPIGIMIVAAIWGAAETIESSARLIEAHHAGIGEQGHPVHAAAAQEMEEVVHQLGTEAGDFRFAKID